MTGSEAEFYVCDTCLNDDGLAEFVSMHAAGKYCSYCDRRQDVPFAAPLDSVSEHIKDCIEEEYTDPVEELPYETAEGGYLGTVLNGIDLLIHVGFEPKSEDLFDDISQSVIDHDWCERDYFALRTDEKLIGGWHRFKEFVKHKRRFTFWSMKDSDVSEYHPDYMPVGETLAMIADQIHSAGLVQTLGDSTEIWRVRVHKAGSRPTEAKELSPPPIQLATKANRMTPAGIVMFYGAGDFETACIETISPTGHLNQFVTGCIFRPLRPLRILNLTDLPRRPSIFQRGASELRHALSFLREFVIDLAVPVADDEHASIAYAPTQAFTEYVRYELRGQDDPGIDGICYFSSRNGGKCYVLFCEQQDCLDSPTSGPNTQLLRFDPTSLRTSRVAGFRVDLETKR